MKGWMTKERTVEGKMSVNNSWLRHTFPDTNRNSQDPKVSSGVWRVMCVCMCD